MNLMNTTLLARTVRQMLTTGGALGLMAFAMPSLAAETDASCFAPSATTESTQRAEMALSATQNICIRAVHEGRAALLLPDAQQAIDDVALTKGLSEAERQVGLHRFNRQLGDSAHF